MNVRSIYYATISKKVSDRLKMMMMDKARVLLAPHLETLDVETQKWKSVDDARTPTSLTGHAARSTRVPTILWRLPTSRGRPLRSLTVSSPLLWRRLAHPRHHQKITMPFPPRNLSSAGSLYATPGCSPSSSRRSHGDPFHIINPRYTTA